MSFRTVLAFAAAAVLSQAAAPSTLTEMVDRAQAAHAGKARIGVVCHYNRTRDQIEALRALLPATTQVVVIDARTPGDLNKACSSMKRQQVDVALVLPWDTTFSQSSLMGRKLQHQLGTLGIPTVQ